MEDGGYDYKFTEDPPDYLKCSICLFVVREARQHSSCGKLFCKSCINKYTELECPLCRQPLSTFRGHSTLFHDLRSDQEVKSLNVFCKLSCGWEGELGAMKDHMNKSCANAMVPCPNKCNSGTTRLIRQNLETHLQTKCPKRKKPCPQCAKLFEYQKLKNHTSNECPKRRYACPKCGEKGQYDERTTTHLKVCPKVNVSCPKCSVEILRNEYPDHHKSCQHEPVSCKYSDIGCREMVLRKDTKTHERNSVHIHLAIATEKIRELTSQLNCLLKSSVTFKVDDFKNRQAEGNIFYGPPAFTSKKGYKLGLRVDPNGFGDGKDTHVSVYAFLMKGVNDDSLTWPFTGTVTFELLNQLEDRNHHKMTAIFSDDNAASERVMVSEGAQVGQGYHQFVSHNDLYFKSEKNCQYLKDNTLVFRVSAEYPNYKPWLECTQ